MSIKECIDKFFIHIDSLETRDKNLIDGYTREFKEIVYRSRKWIQDNVYPSCAGEKSFNLPKNRYKDILPFDHSRVVLPSVDGIEGSDYINANYVLGVTGRKSYIAAQGPQPATVNDFWRMLWHFKINVVVMVCNEYEGIKFKCQRYWPEKDKEIKYCDDSIAITLVEEQQHGEYVVRILQARSGEEVRLLYQLHYLAWPDHGIPTAIEPILDMLAYSRRYQATDATPMVIHCSAGCGRTGTVIALDYTWSLLKLGKLTLDYSIYNLILHFRTQRPSLVQSEDQYLFVYLVVKELFQRHLTLLEEHFYENVDVINGTSVSDPRADSTEDENAYQEVEIVPTSRVTGKPNPSTPKHFNEKFPVPRSSSSTPDYNKTPEVPMLKPVPVKRNSNEPGTLKGPPKAQRVFSIVDSPTNATIRNTLLRLYSSGSETDSDVLGTAAAAVQNDKATESRPVKPNKLALAHNKKSPLQTVVSPTQPSKPALNPKPRISSSTSPGKAAPEKPAKDSSGQRNRIKGLVSSFEKSASLDDGDSSRARLASSNSDSSSVNTVFTSDKGSPSAGSEISVFSSDNAIAEQQNHSSARDLKGTTKDRKSSALSVSKENNLNLLDIDTTSVMENKLQSNLGAALLYDEATSPAQPGSRSQANAATNKSNVESTQHYSYAGAAELRRDSEYSDVSSCHEGTADMEYSSATSPHEVNSPTPGSRPSDNTSKNVSTYRRKERVYEELSVVDDLDDGTDVEGQDPYAYAGVTEGNKWSLQHIALGKPAPAEAPAPRKPSQTPSVKSASSEYSLAKESDEYAVSVSSSDDESSAPAVPEKNYDLSDLEDLKKSLSTQRHGSTSSTKSSEEQGGVYCAPANYQSGGTLGRLFGAKMTKLNLNKKSSKSESSGITHLSPPPAVKYKGRDISFGKRVGKPTGGRNNSSFESKR